MNLLFFLLYSEPLHCIFTSDNRYIIKQVAVSPAMKSEGLPKWLMLSECFSGFLARGCKTVAGFSELLLLPVSFVSSVGNGTFQLLLNFQCWTTGCVFKNYSDYNSKGQKGMFSNYRCSAKLHSPSLTFCSSFCGLNSFENVCHASFSPI